MSASIFSHSDYRGYLEQVIRTAPKAGHGYRQKLANAMDIQATYLSQVLKGDRDLSTDQGVLLADFLHHSKDEAEFLVLLINYSRAGSVKSRKFFEGLLEERREKYLNVKTRVRIQNELKDEDKARYYSDVIYGAVHMAVTIPNLRTVTKIAERFRVTPERIREVVAFLMEVGLIEKNGDELLPGKTLLFVEKSSPHVIAHHRNWRLKALDAIGRADPSDYNISLGITLSEKDAKLIRQKLARLIEEVAEQIKESPEEKLMGFNLDFFTY